MTINPGAFRIISPPSDGSYLTGYDVQVEVQQADGAWLKLRSVVSATIKIRPDGPVIATLEVLTGEMDLEALDPAEVELKRARFPALRWRLLNWWQRARRWVGRVVA